MGAGEPAGSDPARGVFAESVPRARGSGGAVEKIPGTVRTWLCGCAILFERETASRRLPSLFKTGKIRLPLTSAIPYDTRRHHQ